MDTRLYRAMFIADGFFTKKHGIGDNLTEFDTHLMSTVEEFNRQHGTSYDPYNSLHDYLEAQMQS